MTQRCRRRSVKRPERLTGCRESEKAAGGGRSFIANTIHLRVSRAKPLTTRTTSQAAYNPDHKPSRIQPGPRAKPLTTQTTSQAAYKPDHKPSRIQPGPRAKPLTTQTPSQATYNPDHEPSHIQPRPRA